MAAQPVLRVLERGLGISIQDQGRIGFRRFGVPVSGWMDRHAALAANRLLNNDPALPLLEFLLQGARLSAMQPLWVALTGAVDDASIPTWRVVHLDIGQLIHLRGCASGVWSYLAVESGFAADRLLGSASYYARGDFGSSLQNNSFLHGVAPGSFSLANAVSGRVWNHADRRDYNRPPVIKVVPGPQWESFDQKDQDLFIRSKWKVHSRSDRVGYRLDGPALRPEPAEIISEPVQIGSIQVPENGQPIITMRDGPTVGGYPKIAVIAGESDLDFVAQTRPGLTLQFELPVGA